MDKPNIIRFVTPKYNDLTLVGGQFPNFDYRSMLRFAEAKVSCSTTYDTSSDQAGVSRFKEAVRYIDGN